MTRAVFTAALCATATFVFTACSSGNTEAGRQDSNHAPAGDKKTAPALPYGGAPKVERPLHRSVLSGGPCKALTVAQLKHSFGKPVPGKFEDFDTGPTCTWARLDSGAQIEVYYVTRTHAGLSADYANTRPKSRVWRPLPLIQGFPAVAHSDGSRDMCAVSVGIADDLSFDVVGFLGDSGVGHVDPCHIVAQTADFVVTTLRRKAGG